ncbi:MAG: NAD(P)-binding domain-containing protein [Candidatus Hodarchaeales archaeon]|jgi:pyrroline-5-carboxylate reductase
MIKHVGFIGVGHLASYLVEGLRKASQTLEIILSPRNASRAANLSRKFNAVVADSNQAVVDNADVILLTTRPADSIVASKSIDFSTEHTVISVAAGLSLKYLETVTAPATLVRAMPISCAAINRSPTVIFPNHVLVHEIFSLIGQVHVLPDEASFTSASVIAAFYGWMYALMNEILTWTIQSGVPPNVSRNLVFETIQGAVEMTLTNSNQDLEKLLGTLTTSGGITDFGLNILQQKNGLIAWKDALEAVRARLLEQEVKSNRRV